MGDAADDPTDAELLAGAAPGAADREAAFRALVARHGPTVYGVCRRVLGDGHAAEDAFQAVFLVLARRAAAAPRLALGAWLYGVAFRVALKARTAARRRDARERAAAARRREATTVTHDPAADDLRAVVDEELNRLPEKLRAAVVLCDIQGLSRRDAAGQLGVPESTLSSRLQLARDRLARQLTRRGVTLSAVGGLAVAVPAALAQQTAAAATGAGASPMAAALADEAVRALAWGWVPPGVAAAVAAVLTAAGLWVALGPAGPRFRDDFDGPFRPGWRVVRSNPAAVSLARHPGELTVVTQEGTMIGDWGQVRPRNLYLIPTPGEPGGDFTATTRVVGFRPTGAYHQAGLLLYDGDDDYVKFVYEFDWDQTKGTRLAVVRETAGEAWIRHSPSPAGAETAVWLRLTKRGATYRWAARTDGGAFVDLGETEWQPAGPRRVGLIAKNGGVGVIPEIEARFDFFEVTVP